MDYDALLDLGTELGYKLVLSGAEIYRVEESVLRLLTAYGLQPQVFALPSCLIVSVNTPSGHPITQMRRVPPHGTDIELLERCNELCRRLCREVPPLPEAAEQVRKLGQDHRAYPTRILLLGYAAVMFKEEYDDDDEFDLVAYFDVVLEDSMQFPPAFIWQSMRDGLINYQTALTLCNTLAKRGVPVEMHLFPYGDHGQGLAAPENGDGYHPLSARWSRLMNEWLSYYEFSAKK